MNKKPNLKLVQSVFPIANSRSIRVKDNKNVPYRLLCLKLGIKTGWAFFNSKSILTSGCQSFEYNPCKQSNDTPFIKFLDFLHKLSHYPNDIQLLVYYEDAPFHENVNDVHIYGRFMAHLKAWCTSYSIYHEEVPFYLFQRYMTRHITRENKFKGDIFLDRIRELGHQPANKIEADAIALAYWAMNSCLGEE